MYEYRATITSVHDGDTLRADVDLGFAVHLDNEPFRLLGLNAPELGTAAGRAARDYLRSLLPLGAVVVIRTKKDEREKYGRLLAEVWDRDEAVGDSVNDLLISAGHAFPWDGTGPRPTS